MRELAHDLPWPSGPAYVPLRQGQTARATPLPTPEFELGASTVICEVALQAGVPAVVEDYIPALGRWPGLRVVPLEPAIPLHLRLITTLQRPVPMAAKVLGEACRRVVAQRFR